MTERDPRMEKYVEDEDLAHILADSEVMLREKKIGLNNLAEGYKDAFQTKIADGLRAQANDAGYQANETANALAEEISSDTTQLLETWNHTVIDTAFGKSRGELLTTGHELVPNQHPDYGDYVTTTAKRIFLRAIQAGTPENVQDSNEIDLTGSLGRSERVQVQTVRTVPPQLGVEIIETKERTLPAFSKPARPQAAKFAVRKASPQNNTSQ